MSERWKYGNYQFRINPNSFDQSIEIVGDNVRTLTGALISQPTTMVENYNLTSVFFQQRTRVLSEFSVGNGVCFEFNEADQFFYVINTALDRITINNNNFSSIGSISLSAVPVKNYLAIDVTSWGFWIISKGVTDYKLYKLDFNGALLSTYIISMTSGDSITGIKELSGYLYILRDSTIEKYSISNMTKIDSISLPSLYYSGLSKASSVLIVSQFDDFHNNVIYHIDPTQKAIVNNMYNDDIKTINDITYDGTYFYTLNKSTYAIQKINGNTTLLDIFNLEKEITYNKFVIMTDDLGTDRRVRIDSMSKQRRPQNEMAFDVNLKINKVNRG